MKLRFLITVALVISAACTPNTDGGTPEESGASNPIAVATASCLEVGAGIPGLDAWVESVRSAHGISVSLFGVSPSDALKRSDGYELLEINHAFGPLREQLRISADAIRRLGPDCIERYDLIMQVSDNLVVLAAAEISCTINPTKSVSIWACPSVQLGKWREQLVLDPLSQLDLPINPPSPEYLAALTPWVSKPGDTYALGASISTAVACEATSGALQAPALVLAEALASIDFLFEDVHSSPLTSKSSSKTSAVHNLWESDSPTAADDAGAGYWNAFTLAAAKKNSLAAEIRVVLLDANVGIREICASMETSVADLLGPVDQPVPKGSKGLGSMGSVVSALEGCESASFRKKQAEALGNPLLTEEGMCVRILVFRGLSSVIGDFVDVAATAGQYSNFVTVKEAQP